MATDPNMRRLLSGAREVVEREWGLAFDKLGARIQRALLAERVLILAAQQDDETAAEIVRRIVTEGYAWAVAETEEI